MNKKGEVVLGVLLAAGILLAGTGFYTTHKNGVLKNNGKKIWCKMQNKGEDFCNETYKFTPEPYHWELDVPRYIKDV